MCIVCKRGEEVSLQLCCVRRYSGGGGVWQASPSPSHYSVGIHGCMIGVGGGVLQLHKKYYVSFRSVGGIVVSIAAFQAVDPGLIPGRRSFVLQVLKTESYHEFESQSCY